MLSSSKKKARAPPSKAAHSPRNNAQRLSSAPGCYRRRKTNRDWKKNSRLAQMVGVWFPEASAPNQAAAAARPLLDPRSFCN